MPQPPNLSAYVTSLESLSPAQLAQEAHARLLAFNAAEERRESWTAIDECRQKYRLAMRQLAKVNEVKR